MNLRKVGRARRLPRARAGARAARQRARVLTEDEKELGVALVEMGAGTTDLAVFHEGKIRHLGTVNFGGNNVTSDIVQGIGVTQADAEVQGMCGL